MSLKINHPKIIGKLNQNDAESVYKIALSHYSPKPEKNNDGFLVFLKSIKEYKQAIHNASLSIKVTRKNSLIGYAICYSWKDLQIANKINNVEIQSLISKITNPNKIIYIDQIAVKKHFQRIGIGQSIITNLFKMHPLKSLSAAIVISPILNEASYNLFINKNHWKPIDIIQIDNIRATIVISKK